MITKHKKTPQERAFEQLVGEQWESLSDSAHDVLNGAFEVAFRFHMSISLSFGGPDADLIMKEVYLASAGLTDHDRAQLTEIRCALLAAAASVDPDDDETLVYYSVYRSDLHRYYTLFSELVEDVLEKKHAAERLRRIAEQGPSESA